MNFVRPNIRVLISFCLVATPLYAAKPDRSLLPSGRADQIVAGDHWCNPADCWQVGNGWCDADKCLMATETVAGQFRELAECLTGPNVSPGPSCRCADLFLDDEITLYDFAMFQNAPMYVCRRDLAISQEPGFGFCPVPDAIRQASLIPTLDGPPLLLGTIAVWGDPNVDDCLWGFELDCYVALPFPPRLLSEKEVAGLSELLEEIPPRCECSSLCSAFDPCRVTFLRFGARNLDDFCDWRDPIAGDYQAAIQDVLDYLTELAISP